MYVSTTIAATNGSFGTLQKQRHSADGRTQLVRRSFKFSKCFSSQHFFEFQYCYSLIKSAAPVIAENAFALAKHDELSSDSVSDLLTTCWRSFVRRANGMRRWKRSFLEKASSRRARGVPNGALPWCASSLFRGGVGRWKLIRRWYED